MSTGLLIPLETEAVLTSLLPDMPTHKNISFRCTRYTSFARTYANTQARRCDMPLTQWVSYAVGCCTLGMALELLQLSIRAGSITVWTTTGIGWLDDILLARYCPEMGDLPYTTPPQSLTTSKPAIMTMPPGRPKTHAAATAATLNKVAKDKRINTLISPLKHYTGIPVSDCKTSGRVLRTMGGLLTERLTHHPGSVH